MPSEVWDKITPFPNFNGCSLDNGYVISPQHFMIDVIT